jgi:hypothetical protein
MRGWNMKEKYEINKGKWIFKEEKDAFFCSLCDQEALIDANTIGVDFAIAELSDFCPHCGAIMGDGSEPWISVKDRLPEESGIYLVFSNLGNRLILDYSARHKLFNSFDSYSTEQAKGFAIAVTHWMPLPEPPETKGESEL